MVVRNTLIAAGKEQFQLVLSSCPPEISEPWMTRKGLADWLRVSPGTIDNWARRKIITRFKKGAVVRFHPAVCLAALNAFTRPPSAAAPIRPPGPAAAEITKTERSGWKTKKEIQNWVQISERTVEHWTNDGTLPRFKIDGITRYDFIACWRSMQAQVTGGIGPAFPEPVGCVGSLNFCPQTGAVPTR